MGWYGQGAYILRLYRGVLHKSLQFTTPKIKVFNFALLKDIFLLNAWPLTYTPRPNELD